ncbi:No hits found [Brachyspira pilosicoli B2904]|uniref:No hits found n=1 Tax=Brachyspira pilosicoli B2904 TaxID=1133568 RepID=J9USU9_BRAPL|nr:hypothetical protein [Brachyspira pilosicoli]AFR71920.1 No hits found [Brachyspira pilosicoli B2904]
MSKIIFLLLTIFTTLAYSEIVTMKDVYETKIDTKYIANIIKIGGTHIMRVHLIYGDGRILKYYNVESRDKDYDRLYKIWMNDK